MDDVLSSSVRHYRCDIISVSNIADVSSKICSSFGWLDILSGLINMVDYSTSKAVYLGRCGYCVPRGTCYWAGYALLCVLRLILCLLHRILLGPTLLGIWLLRILGSIPCFTPRLLMRSLLSECSRLRVDMLLLLDLLGWLQRKLERCLGGYSISWSVGWRSWWGLIRVIRCLILKKGCCGYMLVVLFGGLMHILDCYCQ